MLIVVVGVGNGEEIVINALQVRIICIVDYIVKVESGLVGANIEYIVDGFLVVSGVISNTSNASSPIGSNASAIAIEEVQATSGTAAVLHNNVEGHVVLAPPCNKEVIDIAVHDFQVALMVVVVAVVAVVVVAVAVAAEVVIA